MNVFEVLLPGMTTSVGSLLAALRIRPITERRILAGAAYGASAALVLAIWVGSLRSTLRDIPTTEATALGQPTLNDSTPPTPSIVNQPATPLALLGEAVRALAGSLKTVAGRLEQTAGTEGEALGSDASVSAAAMRAQAAPDLLQASAVKDLSQPPPVQQKTNGPAALAEVLTPKSYSSYATARLLGSPLDLPVRPHRNDATGRLGAIMRYNVAQLWRAASDAYHYFTP
jgi:hypothetical protein